MARGKGMWDQSSGIRDEMKSKDIGMFSGCHPWSVMVY
jgi:hypothetical protein